MPELPEVEVATRQLRSWLLGRRVVKARAAKSRVIRPQDPRRFGALAGHALQGIERRGKWMMLDFDGSESLISHLGMTGKWIRRHEDEAPPSHVRASLLLDDGNAVDYRDPRLFGRLLRGKSKDLRDTPGWNALGPDPLTDGIDVARLQAVLSKTRRSLKEALMDQRTLAGLGNIHVGESLHRSGLHPQRAASSLSPAESLRLASAIGESIRFALSQEDGPEPIVYVEEDPSANVFLVYARAGEPCPDCGTPIERIVQGGRSTFFCPHCQPLRPARAQKKRSQPR